MFWNGQLERSAEGDLSSRLDSNRASSGKNEQGKGVNSWTNEKAKNEWHTCTQVSWLHGTTVPNKGFEKAGWKWIKMWGNPSKAQAPQPVLYNFVHKGAQILCTRRKTEMTFTPENKLPCTEHKRTDRQKKFNIRKMKELEDRKENLAAKNITEKEKPKVSVSLPYVGGLSEKIRRSWNHCQSDWFLTQTLIWKVVKGLKTKEEGKRKQVWCMKQNVTCKKSYIGETAQEGRSTMAMHAVNIQSSLL